MNEEPIDTIKSYINTACEMPEAEGWEDITTEMVEWSDSMSKIRARLAGQLRNNTAKIPTPFQLQLDAFRPTVDAKLLEIVKWRKEQREAMAIKAESEHDQPESDSPMEDVVMAAASTSVKAATRKSLRSADKGKAKSTTSVVTKSAKPKKANPNTTRSEEKCERCDVRNLECTGTDGRSCNLCAKAKLKCSKSTGTVAKARLQDKSDKTSSKTPVSKAAEKTQPSSSKRKTVDTPEVVRTTKKNKNTSSKSISSASARSFSPPASIQETKSIQSSTHSVPEDSEDKSSESDNYSSSDPASKGEAGLHETFFSSFEQDLVRKGGSIEVKRKVMDLMESMWNEHKLRVGSHVKKCERLLKEAEAVDDELEVIAQEMRGMKIVD